jgi:hypothetical protein
MHALRNQVEEVSDFATRSEWTSSESIDHWEWIKLVDCRIVTSRREGSAGQRKYCPMTKPT